uniref:Uncharacterized protein n=1 Tax=Podoviridae sp. cttxo15 TaxID=2826584 RepID=A0A8S5N2A5_9CAUD|nr:MAG TPA: hypothetical protein [Podoviridae sp. cttxo15]
MGLMYFMHLNNHFERNIIGSIINNFLERI